MILSCANIKKSFNENVILKDASFHIEDHEKAAIVGINGAGKSTLIKIIVGLLSADSGTVAFSKDKTMGYLSQQSDLNSSSTIYKEVESVKENLILQENELRNLEEKMNHVTGEELDHLVELYTKKSHAFELSGGYLYKSEINGVLKGLGFTEKDYDTSIATLSGGQKTRVSLAKLLLENPDLIILDEPTNHLDIRSINWLENYLTNYKGAVLIVSHDRYFLDRIVTKVISIDNGNVRAYSGNYSDFAMKAAEIRKAQIHAYLKQQSEIQHQQAVIDKLKSFNREKSIKRAESREKMLDKIEVLEKPTEIRDDMQLTLTPRIMSGNDVLTLDQLGKSYGEKKLFDQTSLLIKRGEHVAIIGDNGTGKTTLLKMINGLTEITEGEITLGVKVEIGYYDQEHHVLHEEKTLFDEISDDYPTLTNTEIRNTLAAFLFTGDDVFKQIKSLSGGERGRVSLAKLMLSNANFLILDEPTNHLDITSKEILEQALNQYEGTVLYVSHDRFFVNQTASRIFDLENKHFYEYNGNYDYYVEKHDDVVKAYAALNPNTEKDMKEASPFSNTNSETKTQNQSASKESGTDSADSKLSWQEQKELQAKQRKLQNQLKKCEEEIEALETKIESLNEQLLDPAIATNSVKLQEVSATLSECTELLETKYEEWEQLSE